MAAKSRTILLVDDYPDALEVWCLYLQMCGFDVITAADGADAVAMAVSRQPDLIILDLELPVLSGVEAARILRGRTDTSCIPLIAATGHSQAARLDEARLAGFDLVVTKPCDPEFLVGEIRRLLPMTEDDGAAANNSSLNR